MSPARLWRSAKIATFFRIGDTNCHWRALALLLILAARICHAAEDADLKPIPERSPLSGRIGAVGVVILGEPERMRSIGTGFLVTTCHVLTARHVLALDGERVRIGTQVRFVPTLGSVAVALARRAVFGEVVAAGASIVPAEAAQKGGYRANQDWALIELEHPIANIEPLKILYPGASLAPGVRMSAVGYSASAHMLSINVDEHCALRRNFHGRVAFPGVLFADCAVRSGMSGGPLLIDTGTQLIAAAIIVERVEIGEEVTAVGVSAQAFADKIGTVMRASQVCAAGQPFAFSSAYRGQAHVHTDE